MFNDKILKSVAEAVKDVLQQEALKGQQHKIDKNKNNKIDAHDFKILRGEKKPVEESSHSKEKPKVPTNNPFDVKNYKSQIPTKPGELAGFDSKKISTGTVYTRKPVKDEKPLKEEDAYDKDRYAVKDGKAVKDNPGHMGSANYKDQPHHVWASSAEEAMKKKGMKEEASNDEFHAEVKKAKEKSLGKQMADVAKPAVSAVKQESVEQVDEATMTHITLGKKVKNSDGGHNQDVHYKGKKIGHIESYKHRSGIKYGDEHDATGEGTAGHRSMDDAIDSLRQTHAEHLKSMKEEVQIDEREMTGGEMNKREKIVKSMKKGMQGFKDRYGDRAKEVMYATATKQAMKEAFDEFTSEEIEEFLQTEEFQQLDELSKNALAKYHVHADLDIGRKVYDDHARSIAGALKKATSKNNPAQLHKTAPKVHKALLKAAEALKAHRDVTTNKIKQRADNMAKARMKISGGPGSRKVVKGTGKFAGWNQDFSK